MEFSINDLPDKKESQQESLITKDSKVEFMTEDYEKQIIKTKTIRNYVNCIACVILGYLLSLLIIIGTCVSPSDIFIILMFILTCILMVIILLLIIWYLWKWKYANEMVMFYKFQ